MKINHITLYDYGVYAGEQTLRLSGGASADRGNITLIGGMNGAGKSSIFQAIQICLYGQAALGPMTSRRVYEAHLKDLIHDGNGLLTNEQASVVVDFAISLGGEKADYCVKRTWAVRGASLVETVDVKKNGQPIGQHEQNYWQDFIQHLIPQGLLSLFFFDGERISALIKSEDSQQLAESIQALFGLGVIRQLRADLRYIERKESGRSQKATELEGLIAKTEANLLALTDSRQVAFEKIAELRPKLESKGAEIIDWRRKLNKKGGSTGADPAELQKKLAALSRQMDEKSTQLKQLFQGALPFCFAKEFMGFTLARLSGGETQGAGYANLFEKNWTAALSEIEQIVKTGKAQLRLKALLCPPKVDKSASVEAFTLGETEQIQRWFQDEAQDALIEACRVVDQIEGLTRETSAIRAMLEAIPEGVDVADELDQVDRCSRELGQLESRLAVVEEEEKGLTARIELAKRELEKLQSQLDDESLGSRKTVLVAKSIKALELFEEKLVQRKIGELEKNFIKCFNKLMRKDDMISSIRISPKTFEITLIGAGGKEVPRKKLSEGEKQVFAISLLHAITQTSRCPFPIIVDTPLGRLDSIHREKIIRNYLPYASHQVVVLSTDTEVDQGLYKELKPHINKTFMLTFDAADRRTEIREGYFAFGVKNHESAAN